jgi:hypothetical protein
MSASFAGSSGSGSGSSSSSVSGASSSGVSGGSASLTKSILNSVALAGENIPLGGSNPSLAAPYNATPVNTPGAVSTLGVNSMWVWIVAGVAILVGLFAFHEL